MMDLLTEYSKLLAEGLLRTLILTLISFSLGFLISMVLTVTRYLAKGPLRLVAEAYINFFRGTPLLVQILFLYFGLPSLGVKLNAFTAAALAIGLNSGAYQAEIVRTGIKGIHEEQITVARSLGFSEVQVFRYVVLPQALRNAIPGLTNEFVTLLKETSLASVIGVMELTRVGEYMTSATFRALESYLLVALIYLGVSYAYFKFFKKTEKLLAIPGFERWV